MPHSLIEIPRTEWTKLRDLYTAQKRVSTGYNMLQNFTSWVEQNPELNVKIYALDGDWQQDGTFILEDYSNFYYFNTLSDNLERLVQALNCLDTSTGYLLAGFPERLLPAVEQHFEYAGVSKEQIQPESTGYWHHIPKEKATQFTVDTPAGLTLARLDVCHADHVNALWPHRAPGSVTFVERLIRYNDSVGTFDQQGKLVAWCLRLPLGSLGLLQVEDTHKHQGLGSLVVRYMSKLIAEKDEEVMAPVVVANVASRGMFAKLGFKIDSKVYWALNPTETTD